MFSDMNVVFVRYRLNPHRRRHALAFGRQEVQRPVNRSIQKLASDFACENLGNQRGYCVAEHPLHFRAATLELQSIRKGLQTAKFLKSELSAIPVESSVRSAVKG